MRVRRLSITNFRGVRDGVVDFAKHALLVGGNNTGKSTLCEALDLVLGPERLSWRPVVDEHDFYRGRYHARTVEDADEVSANLADISYRAAIAAATNSDDGPAGEIRQAVCLIRIEAMLVDLPGEAERRFRGHLRRWSENLAGFVDETDSPAPEDADAEDTSWALPVAFLGRYNREEDDFEGGTFFLHPRREVAEEDASKLGAGLAPFTRDDKRLCGFVFLRALRTGSRALTLQKGSVLDTILRLAGDDAAEMWVSTLDMLQGLSPPIGHIPHLKMIQEQIQRRARQFIGLAPGDSTGFFASELTREHLREVVRLFVASEQSAHLLPFHRLGTGTINVLVFALLTFIAELKSNRSVIFAMEEPEIALPPHTQRRIVRFVLREMGQAVVTSHSPYVIQQLESEDIVVLSRGADGRLRARPLEAGVVTSRMLRTQRRQFAEAVLGQAILVVEGGTEVALCHAVSTALELFLPPETYLHLDLAGVTVFNAGSDGEVPKFGPVFAGMQKPAFALYDKQRSPWSPEEETALAAYQSTKEHEYSGIEDLLVAEVPVSVHRAFLERAASRNDYPQRRRYAPGMTDNELLKLSKEVLVARKGEGSAYCALLIASCESVDELPATIVGLLTTIHQELHGEAALVPAGVPTEAKMDPEASSQ